MRSIFLLVSLLFIFSFTNKSADCNCKNKLSVSESFQKADVVVLGRLEEFDEDDDGMRYVVREEKVWKNSARVVLINDRNCPVEFIEGENYLIYANKTSNGHFFITNACTRTKLKIDAEEDMKILDFIAPCIDSSLINRDPNVIVSCPRVMDPVLGCDGKLYDSPCEAIKRGVVVYSKVQQRRKY